MSLYKVINNCHIYKLLLIVSGVIFYCGMVFGNSNIMKPDSINETDTVSMSLDEVVVEGRTQRVIANGIEYVPGKKIKRAATDAISLLANMQLPQLLVTPGSKDVKTISGKSVKIFIDYIPASAEDIEGMRPEDVLRVEVLSAPTDARFGSALNVVNFIMVKYDWGGYTKLSAQARLISDNLVYGSVYQKFNYRQWRFLAAVTGRGLWQSKYRNHETEIYRDFDLMGTHYDELTRLSDCYDSYRKENSQNAMFSADWHTDKYYIQHTARFNRSATPYSKKYSSVEYCDPMLSTDPAIDFNSNQDIYASVDGYYQFSFPQGNSMVVDWRFLYGHQNRETNYSLGDLVPIVNKAEENVYSPLIDLSYSKKLGHDNSLSINLRSVNYIFNTNYTGSYMGLQKLLTSENMAYANYTQSWDFGLNLLARAGINYMLGRVNGENTIDNVFPRLGLRLQYKITDKHKLSLDGWWLNSSPQPDTYNTAVVQSNELL